MNELGVKFFYIELYELFKCNTKEELNKREGEIIRQIGTLNMVIPGRKQKEYYNDNKGKIQSKAKITNKIYYSNHTTEIKEKNNIIRLFNKEHFEKNKDIILEPFINHMGLTEKQKYDKQYYLDNFFLNSFKSVRYISIGSVLEILIDSSVFSCISFKRGNEPNGEQEEQEEQLK